MSAPDLSKIKKQVDAAKEVRKEGESSPLTGDEYHDLPGALKSIGKGGAMIGGSIILSVIAMVGFVIAVSVFGMRPGTGPHEEFSYDFGAGLFRACVILMLGILIHHVSRIKK